MKQCLIVSVSKTRENVTLYYKDGNSTKNRTFARKELVEINKGTPDEILQVAEEVKTGDVLEVDPAWEK